MACMTDKKYAYTILPSVLAPKAPLGGNMLRWGDSINMDLNEMRF